MVVSSLVNGLVGGLVATVVMTGFMMTLGGDDPPPTAVFWAKYVGTAGPEDYLPQGMALHFIYGMSAGGAFGVLIRLLNANIVDLGLWIVAGVGYGVVLFVVAAVFWMNIVLALEPERKEVGLFLLFHLVYGTVLGAWMSLGIPLS